MDVTNFSKYPLSGKYYGGSEKKIGVNNPTAKAEGFTALFDKHILSDMKK